MGLHIESLPKSPHLCSLHLLKSYFDRSSLLQTRLKGNVIPIVKIISLFEVLDFN